MAASSTKKSARKPRPIAAKRPASPRLVRTRTNRPASDSSIGSTAARSSEHDIPPSVPSYSPKKGVTAFATEVAMADTREAIELERSGVSGRYVSDLAKHLGLPTTRVLQIIDMPRATAAKKAAKDEPVNGKSGLAALALTRLLAVANEIAAESTDPKAADFDAGKWLGTWLERPQPALGGRKPAEILDTPTGAAAVSRVLGSVLSGAYQ